MGGKRDEERERRAAEREGRRIRRSKNRSFSAMSSHVDGMSSDDEITETTATTYRNQLGTGLEKLTANWWTPYYLQKILIGVTFLESIESDAIHVFEDVEDEYASIETILNNFADWRQRDKIDYTEAFANVCLPKLLGPFLRMNILFWNPLNKVITRMQNIYENLRLQMTLINYWFFRRKIFTRKNWVGSTTSWCIRQTYRILKNHFAKTQTCSYYLV